MSDVYTLPDLPYDYSALEPHISAEIMQLHHDKHHAAYVKGANTALERMAEARQSGELTFINQLQRDLAFSLAGHGAVSPEVARALADGARERFGAQVGIGITGVAGPGGGTEAKPVGYVCFCVTTAEGQVLARDPLLRGSRSDVRERSTDIGMHLLWRATR